MEITRFAYEFLASEGPKLYMKWTKHYKDFKASTDKEWVEKVQLSMLIEIVEKAANHLSITLDTKEVTFIEEALDQFLITYHLLQSPKTLAKEENLGFKYGEFNFDKRGTNE